MKAKKRHQFYIRKGDDTCLQDNMTTEKLTQKQKRDQIEKFSMVAETPKQETKEGRSCRTKEKGDTTTQENETEKT